MDKNEVKKALYREKPTAKLFKAILDKDGVHKVYEAETSLGKHIFKVRTLDMGEKAFEDELPAQLLIRWLQDEE